MAVSAGELGKHAEAAKETPVQIVAFFCNWCTYAAADLAGSSRLQQPAAVRVVRVPCSGRIRPELVLAAFHRGADGVLVSGCHPGDCHYAQGNYFARRRLAMVSEVLRDTGIDPRRLRFEWCSAAEGIKVAKVIREMAEDVREWKREQSNGHR